MNRQSVGDAAIVRRWVVTLAAVPMLMAASAAHAQQVTDSLVIRGLELEGNGRTRDAALVYRIALGGSDAVSALLGLERVYAELGMLDSLLVPLATAVEQRPDDATVRTVQLRTLHTLGRDDAARSAMTAWTRSAPRDAAPYREYARLLLASGRAGSADSVVTAARRAFGGTAALAGEAAQVAAAAGRWEESAAAWRIALDTEPWLSHAAAIALAGTPEVQRAAVRAALATPPAFVPARQALAALEAQWGSYAEGWNALRDLPVDSASAAAWVEFGEQAEMDGRWAQARIAFERALAWRASDALRLRAAAAALASGDPTAAMQVAPIPRGIADSARVATELVPLHVLALSHLRRPGDAARLVAAWDAYLPPGTRLLLAREVAMGWVRQGDLAQARAALVADGLESDSSAAAGWIALFDGDATTARAMLGRGDERSADVALALAVLARFREAAAPEIGRAFLALAQGDTTAAAVRFEEAARATPRAASLLLLTGARLHAAVGDTAKAITLWTAVVTGHPESAEAPEAVLHHARALIAGGNRAAGVERLEQLILGYPASALVPVARRELEAVRQGGGAGG